VAVAATENCYLLLLCTGQIVAVAVYLKLLRVQITFTVKETHSEHTFSRRILCDSAYFSDPHVQFFNTHQNPGNYPT
jgi:hypothetical protein